MADRETIVLGGGCFWCTEAVFDQVKGVTDVESGYANGWVEHPDYEQVCAGQTGHAEVVKVEFDPAVIGLRHILEIFFAVHDPTTLNRQGHDVGSQYRSGIYCTQPGQKAVARELMTDLEREGVFGRTLVTEVEDLRSYWPAEDYHQDFFARNPYQGYCLAVAAPKVAKLRAVYAQWVK